MQHDAGRCSFARRHDATTRPPRLAHAVKAMAYKRFYGTDASESTAPNEARIQVDQYVAESLVRATCSRCGNYTDAAAAAAVTARHLLDRGFSRRHTIVDSSFYSTR